MYHFIITKKEVFIFENPRNSQQGPMSWPSQVPPQYGSAPMPALAMHALPFAQYADSCRCFPLHDVLQMYLQAIEGEEFFDQTKEPSVSYRAVSMNIENALISFMHYLDRFQAKDIERITFFNHVRDIRKAPWGFIHDYAAYRGASGFGYEVAVNTPVMPTNLGDDET